MRYGWRATIYTPRASTLALSSLLYPRKLYKEQKLAKDGGEKAAKAPAKAAKQQQGATLTHTHTTERRKQKESRSNEKKNGTTAVLHWGTQR